MSMFDPLRRAFVIIATVALVLCGGPALAQEEAPADEDAAKVQEFEELLKRVREPSADPAESEVLRLLEVSGELARDYAATIAIKPYLTRNFDASPRLILAAAHTARRGGDLSAAVSRYKTYLRNADPDATAADAAAHLYRIQLQLRKGNDAFVSMKEFGDKFRKSPNARKYDRWFLNQAWRRNDHPAVAERLVTIFSERMPLEAERVLVWDDLDRLTRELAHADERMFGAVQSARRLAGLVRNDRHRALRLAFVAENLDYAATYAAKDDRGRANDFKAVARAGIAYVKNNPVASTLRDAVFTLGGGARDENDFKNHFPRTWSVQRDQRRAFFAEAFGLLKNDEERAAFVDWRHHSVDMTPLLASAEQWVELGSAHPGAIRKAESVDRLPMLFEVDSVELWKKQAAYLDKAPGMDAAAIRALAAGGGELAPTVEHLLAKENQRLNGGEFSDAIDKRIAPALARLARQNEQDPPEHAMDDAMLAVGPKHVAGTSLAILNREMARRYLLAAWRRAGSEYDRKPVVEHLRNLDWVAWSDSDRKAAVSPAFDAFRSWADQVRRLNQASAKEIENWRKRIEREKDQAAKLKEQASKLKDQNDKQDQFKKVRSQFVEAEKRVKESEAKLADLQKRAEALGSAVEQIASLDEAFQKALDPDVSKDGKAPTELAGRLNAFIRAIDAKDQGAYEKAARAAYKLVRDYDAKRTPFGAAALGAVLWNRGGVKSLDLQMEMLSDQLDRWEPGFDDAPIRFTMDTIVASHRGLDYWRTDRNRRSIAVRISGVLADALAKQIDNERFYDHAFTWLRSFRNGHGWHGWRGDDQNKGFMKKLVESEALLKYTDYRIAGDFAAPTYQWLVTNRWDDYRNTYRVDRSFDGMMAKEARDKGWLDASYFRYGDDPGSELAKLASEMFAAMDKLPLPYGDDNDSPWGRHDVFRWQHHAFRAGGETRRKLLDHLESTWGKGRFDDDAMGAGYFDHSGRIGDDGGPDRDDYFNRLETYLDRAARFPRIASAIDARGVERIEIESLTDREIDLLVGIINAATPDQWDRHDSHVDLANRVRWALAARQRHSDLLDLAPMLWRISLNDHRDRFKQTMLQWTQGMLERELFDLAVVYANVGMDIVGSEVSNEFQAALRTVQARANANVSGVIPVARSDKRYPLFAAQADFLSGKTEAAWNGYAQHRALLREHIREFDPTFLLWLVDRHTNLGQFNDAESLAQEMQIWFEQRAAAVDPELKAQLGLAYARIAFARKEYPRARAFYDSVAKAEAYRDTRAQEQARIMVAAVDRVTGRYDEAVEALETIIRESRMADIKASALYQLALVNFDQEEFAEAEEVVRDIFAVVPDHPLASILEGEIKIRLRKLEEPTEIDIGTVTQKQFIVPGKVLKVGMEDPNLAVVGQATMIELRAWTDSGDEEQFSLTPFGDSRTRFRGELPTELAPIQKGDGRLQVLGKDTVYYDFSESFRKVHNVQLARPKALRVVSDAELLASTGEILTEEEKEERKLEMEIRRSIEGPDAPRAGPRFSQQRAGNIVKPGNRVNIRVIDPDQSKTAERDQLPVRVTASSGDVIGELVLDETDTHSGVFEGVLQTAEGSAIAYASDTVDGRNPNFAVSAGDYPAWEALHDARKPKWFAVDLNDRIRAGAMRVKAAEPGRKVKTFIVEVSPDGRNFMTVGQYPGQFEPWDGAPQLDYMELKNADLADDPAKLRRYVQSGHIGRAKKHSMSIKDLNVNFDRNDFGRRLKVGYGWNAYHFRTAFFQNERRVRQFKIADVGGRTNVYVYLDGELITEKGGTDFRASVDRGVHTLEVYVAAWRETKFRMMTDAKEPPYLKPLPAEDIDPANHPLIRERIDREAAKVTANEDGSEFDVNFGKDTFLRVARLTIVDYETDAPAINRITLTDVDGNRVLPTDQDFMTLRRNQTLEIVPGDVVRVNYRDPTAIEADDELHEAFLEAAYTNAEVLAGFVQVTGRGGNRKTEIIPLRRFEPGDSISMLIDDPDMDVSKNLDVVKFTLRTDSGDTMTLEALETGPYSGKFSGRFFPVAGEADPDKASEVPVEPAEGIQAMYLDKENTDPGVPWERIVNLEQVTWVTPELRAFDFESTRLNEAEAAARAEEAKARAETSGNEFIPPRYTMAASRPVEAGREEPATGSLAFSPKVELLWPTIAKSPESTATIYVQTSSGREKAGLGPDDPFSVEVPGTIKLSTAPNELSNPQPAPGYASTVARGDMYATDPVSDGRFTFSIPTALGTPGDESHAVEKEFETPGRDEQQPLMVNGTDKVYVGFKYTDPDGGEQWKTRVIEMTADPMLDVMDRRYRDRSRDIQVGQKLYFRLIDPKRDVSAEKDEIDLTLTTDSGANQLVRLSETFSHSGVFKGLVEVRHRDEYQVGGEAGDGGGEAGDAPDGAGGEAAAADDDVEADAELEAEAPELSMAVPVVFGDNIHVAYDPQRPGAETLKASIYVRKGDAGFLLPFTKRFADPEIAVQTQFTMAESYFELAKRHRELGNERLAREKVLQGKKLLEEALADFTDSTMRAQAEYLLANLSMEFGDDANNVATKKQFYNEAVTRFSDLVATFPDSEYAPKAQYKKALVYEKMSDFQPSLMDRASEEYVKLSYRYPEHELVADTIVRLGEYFRNKGRAMRDEAAKLDERGERLEAEKIRIQARKMFVTAAQVLARLSERFPQHNLAGKTLVVSAQCAMQGENYELATETFQMVIEDTDMENNLRAMAMFWNGKAYLEMKNLEQAYINLKKLTWDYPATEWARYARGLLASNEGLIEMDERMGRR